MLGVILDLESLDHQDLDLTHLRVALDDWNIFASTNPDDTASRIENASIVVTNKVIIGKTEL
ncbi:MAG: glycerate dehydrogenase, partial [Gammaproteobacteria bacterium]